MSDTPRTDPLGLIMRGRDIVKAREAEANRVSDTIRTDGAVLRAERCFNHSGAVKILRDEMQTMERELNAITKERDDALGHGDKRAGAAVLNSDPDSLFCDRVQLDIDAKVVAEIMNENEALKRDLEAVTKERDDLLDGFNKEGDTAAEACCGRIKADLVRERDEALAMHEASAKSARENWTELTEARAQRDRLAEALKMWKVEGPESNACFCDAQFAMHGAHPSHTIECKAATAALAAVKGDQS